MNRTAWLAFLAVFVFALGCGRGSKSRAAADAGSAPCKASRHDLVLRVDARMLIRHQVPTEALMASLLGALVPKRPGELPGKRGTHLLRTTSTQVTATGLARVRVRGAGGEVAISRLASIHKGADRKIVCRPLGRYRLAPARADALRIPARARENALRLLHRGVPLAQRGQGEVRLVLDGQLADLWSRIPLLRRDAAIVRFGQIIQAAGLSTTMKPPPSSKPPRNGTKRARPPTTFTAGPSISPSKPLLVWLETHKAKRRVLRLPVVLTYPDLSAIHVSGPSDVFIGAAGPKPPPEAIHLKLDTGALGIPLPTRLKTICAGRRGWCALWLEGTWGALVPLPGAGPSPAKPKRWPFAVRRVGERIKPGAGPLRAMVAAGAKPSP